MLTLQVYTSQTLSRLINQLDLCPGVATSFWCFVGCVSSLPSGTRYRWAWDRLGTVTRCTKWHPNGGLGNPVHIVWGRERHPGRISLSDGTRIGDKPGLETCVVSQVVADSLAKLPLEGC